jgi:hypothetical protein
VRRASYHPTCWNFEAAASIIRGTHTLAKAGLGMKRGFLFGLGSFFVVGAIAGLGASGLAGIIVAFICTPLSVVVIRAAKLVPSRGSWLPAFIGWLLGFFAIDAVIFVAIGAAIVVPLLAKII